MKVNVNQIPPEGTALEEEIDPAALDLETEVVKLRGPVKIKAEISRITNAVTVDMKLSLLLSLSCGRCLKEFETAITKNLRFNYPVDKREWIIDLGPDIREEIILDYPMQPLCSAGCKGLCPKCGKNLNEGKCNCVY